MLKFLLIGCAAGSIEAGLLLAAGNPVWLAFLGYTVTGTLALLATAFLDAFDQLD